MPESIAIWYLKTFIYITSIMWYEQQYYKELFKRDKYFAFFNTIFLLDSYYDRGAHFSYYWMPLLPVLFYILHLFYRFMLYWFFFLFSADNFQRLLVYYLIYPIWKGSNEDTNRSFFVISFKNPIQILNIYWYEKSF